MSENQRMRLFVAVRDFERQLESGPGNLEVVWAKFSVVQSEMSLMSEMRRSSEGLPEWKIPHTGFAIQGRR
jgi:hypothetical protein